MYDIIFISYKEPNAEKNWKILKDRFPVAKRVTDVKGIHQAHIAAAKKSFTKMFWVVDGDAEISPSFNFDYEVPEWDLECVHVWRSINPINDLVYGYGGVKLLPRRLVLDIDITTPDMTTSVSKNFKVMPDISNITAFNTDPFSTWKSAFRECAKLASKLIREQKNDETEERLRVWCNEGSDRPFGKYSIAGAICGRNYGYDNITIPDKLKLINNFDWLEEQFRASSL